MKPVILDFPVVGQHRAELAELLTSDAQVSITPEYRPIQGKAQWVLVVKYSHELEMGEFILEVENNG